MIELILGAVVGVGAGYVVRARRVRQHPEIASMTWWQRYRWGWSAERYSRRSWLAMGTVILVFGALDVLVLVVGSDGGLLAVGIVGAIFFAAMAVVSCVQAARTSR